MQPRIARMTRIKIVSNVGRGFWLPPLRLRFGQARFAKSRRKGWGTRRFHSSNHNRCLILVANAYKKPTAARINRRPKPLTAHTGSRFHGSLVRLIIESGFRTRVTPHQMYATAKVRKPNDSSIGACGRKPS